MDWLFRMKKHLAILLLLPLALVMACKKKMSFDEKVLYQVASAKIQGFDPVFASDAYSSQAVGKVYESLYQYHYLKRPYTLVPNLASAMPEVSEDGLTYKIPLKKGVLFHNDECFPNGKGREMKASDVAYSIRRLADPKLQSTGWWLLENKVLGLDEWRKAGGDYSAPIKGLETPDDYTVIFKLKRPFPQFLYALAMTFTSVTPKEAVEKYGEEFLNHPVGTGPFTMAPYEQNYRIVFEKNPNYRQEFYPTEGEESDAEKGLLKASGKTVPFVDKIVLQIIREPQPAWLSFEKGRVDMFGIPKDNFDKVVAPGDAITDAYKEKGIVLHISPSLDITYIAFNNADSLFKDNVHLRRAMSLAYNIDEVNKLFYNGRTLKAQSIIPPGIAGFREDYVNPYREFNLVKAREEMEKAGYPKGEGLPVIKYETIASTTSRQMAEYFVKSMAKIGVRVEVSTSTWPQFIQKVNTKQAQMFGMAWGADYPDGENFLQLLYSPNGAPGSNGSNFSNPVYDSLFATSSVMQDSPERTALYERLNQMAAEQVPMIYGVHRKSFVVKHGWVRNYKYHEFSQGMEKYYDIDLEEKKRLYQKM